MNQKSSLAETLIGLETTLHGEDVRRSQLAAELLADDFVEFGASGRTYKKEELLRALRDDPYHAFQALDFRVQIWAEDVALVTYRTRRVDPPHLEALRSSLWNRRDGKWQMVFHQGSPVGASTAQPS